jgi:riboflavin biosynthesis pyrimidine reductase
VRQIYPVQADGAAGPPLGPADPLRLAGPISPAGGAGWAEDVVASLAAVYACPEGLWIRGNMIASVDGAIALDGRSGGLSGAADRLMFWVLRSLADVVLVGAGTVRAEQYGQVRPSDMWQGLRAGRPATPPIAVLTRRLDLDLDGRLFGRTRTEEPGADASSRTIVLTTKLVPDPRLKAAAAVADVIVAGEHDVTPAATIQALAERGYRNILAEGGPRLLGELTAAGLLDELCLTISPILEGGHSVARTLSAPAGAVAGPAQLRLASLLEDDGFLFSRYLLARAQ